MKLFVGNISYNLSEPELREIFEPFEPILEFHRPHDRETGQPRGFAFVTLMDQEKGIAAIEALDGKELDGRPIKVNEAEDRGSRGPAPPFQRPNPNDVTSQDVKRVDDRPTDKKSGKKIVYKSI